MGAGILSSIRPAASTGREERLVVVSNRLPVRREPQADGSRVWRTSPGGLVSALRPILLARRGTWVGWTGEEAARQPFEHEGLRLHPLELSQAELEGFYHGTSNTTLWPLYHDLAGTPEFHRSWWRDYERVNERYAAAAAAALGPGGVAWIHDYQLQLVPSALRRMRPGTPIGWFCHIPFPPVELFAQLPWRRQILAGILGADVVGFQTRGGASNFAEAVRRFLGAPVRNRRVHWQGREVALGAFPISIDVKRLEGLARRPETAAAAAELRRRLGSPRHLLLGVDRLDYTKGIDQRLKAWEGLLEELGPARRDVVLAQIAVPSRESTAGYADMRTRIEKAVGRINGRWGEPGRSPLHYQYRSLPLEELVTWYVAADVMVVTPLRDGMNLVAKEYVAARTAPDGVLVLSEFAGAARELSAADLVNPHDVDGMIATLKDALKRDPDEVRRGMARLRRAVRSRDVHGWAQSFLDTLRDAHRDAACRA